MVAASSASPMNTCGPRNARSHRPNPSPSGTPSRSHDHRPDAPATSRPTPAGRAEAACRFRRVEAALSGAVTLQRGPAQQVDRAAEQRWGEQSAEPEIASRSIANADGQISSVPHEAVVRRGRRRTPSPARPRRRRRAEAALDHGVGSRGTIQRAAWRARRRCRARARAGGGPQKVLAIRAPVKHHRAGRRRAVPRVEDGTPFGGAGASPG